MDTHCKIAMYILIACAFVTGAMWGDRLKTPVAQADEHPRSWVAPATCEPDGGIVVPAGVRIVQGAESVTYRPSSDATAARSEGVDVSNPFGYAAGNYACVLVSNGVLVDVVENPGPPEPRRKGCVMEVTNNDDGTVKLHCKATKCTDGCGLWTETDSNGNERVWCFCNLPVPTPAPPPTPGPTPNPNPT